MRRISFIISLLLNLLIFSSSYSTTHNFSYKGEMSSIIEIEINQTYVPALDTKILEIEIPSKLNYQSYYFSQEIDKFNNTYSQEPNNFTTKTDSLDNEIIIARWKNVQKPINIITTFEAKISSNVQPLNSNIAYPYKTIPNEIQTYLTPTSLVQSDNKTIKNKAKELVKDIDFWHLAILSILAWVNNNMEYTSEDNQPASVKAYNRKSGNCTSFANLSAALLRSIGIPVRIIGGITFDEAWTVSFLDIKLTQKNSEERHSWIQVWYPDLGWVDYDASSPFFVITSRYIIQNIGLDSYDVKKKWRFSKDHTPKESEDIIKNFYFDDIKLISDGDLLPQRVTDKSKVVTFSIDPNKLCSTIPGTYTYQGNMITDYEVELIQEYDLSTGTKTLALEISNPQDYTASYFSQTISNYKIDYSSIPSKTEIVLDEYNNKIQKLTWHNWDNKIDKLEIKTTFTVHNNVALYPLESNASYPSNKFDEDIQLFLEGTELVQKDYKGIQEQSKKLTDNVENWHEAVMNILDWVNDYMRYDRNPESIDAIQAFETHSGHSPCFVHLALALLRSASIPARVVSGIAFRKPWLVSFPNGNECSDKMMGNIHRRRVWIEIYYPDIGWVPYDLLQKPYFVISSRHLALKIGMDVMDTRDRVRVLPVLPKTSKAINAEFISDEVDLMSTSSMPSLR